MPPLAVHAAGTSAAPSAVLNLAGNKLTKVGANTIYATVDGTITAGDIDVNAGTFGIWNGTVLGAGNIKVEPGAVLELSNMVDGKFNRQVTLNGGSITSVSTNGATSNGNVIYTAASVINNAQGLTLTGPITQVGGPFDLVKTGAGSLNLLGTNGLTGRVDVSTGILRVSNEALLGSATGADAIILQNGGRLQAEIPQWEWISPSLPTRVSLCLWAMVVSMSGLASP